MRAAIIFPAIDEMLTMLPPVTLLDQAATERAAHVEGAVQVDVDHAVPQLEIEVDDRHAVGAPRGAGVVHHDVDPAHLVDHPLGERVDRGGIGHVAHDGQRAAAERAHLVGDRLDVAPARLLLVVGVLVGRAAGTGQHHVATGASELDRDRPADRAHAAGAGHDGDLSVESRQCEARHGRALRRQWRATVTSPPPTCVSRRRRDPAADASSRGGRG